VLDYKVMMEYYSSVLECRQHGCVVRSWKYDRQEELVVTGTRCNWNAQLLELLQCGLIETLEDDHAELENSYA